MSTHQNLADPRRIRAAEEGTRQRPEDVLAAQRDSVWAFVLRQVGDRSLADDLTQEALLRAERSIGTWRSEATLRSWMCAIAINVVRDHFRSHQRTPESTSLAVAAEPACPRGGPERTLLESEMAACVDGYVSQLPRLQHQVLALHDIAGLTHAEIATVLGVSVGNSRVLLHRGRAALRRVLEENCLLSFGGEGVPCERKPVTAAR
jgi:RNA polymerase sigma-70 factor (ECF subfamily)